MTARYAHIAIAGFLAMPTFACNKQTEDEAKADKASVTSTASSTVQDIETIVQRSTPAVKKAAANSAKIGGADETERWIETKNLEVFRVVDPVSQRLADATDAFVDEDAKAASESLEEAARALVAETDGLDASMYSELRKSSAELKRLAADVSSGKANAAKFNRGVADAYAIDLSRRWVVLDDVTWLRYYDQPDIHFNRAQAALSYDKKLAATELAKVASYVRLQEYRATGASKTHLEHASGSLLALAHKLQAGTTTHSSALDDVRFDTSHALAYFHYHQLADGSARHKRDRSSAEWKAVLHHLKSLSAAAPSADAAKLVTELHTWLQEPNDVAAEDENVIADKLATAERLLTECEQTKQPAPAAATPETEK